jgi:phosphoglycerate dehydrogenase-like enzyme
MQRVERFPAPTEWNPRRFRVCFTGDSFLPDGSFPSPDVGLGVFQGHKHIELRGFPSHTPEITPDQLGADQGVIIRASKLTRSALQNSGNLLAAGRFGVGYDNVDVAACTAADVVAFITPGAVDRCVAEATLCWMLALSHNVMGKDRLVREARWNDPLRHQGREIGERTLGIVGLGRIGKALAALVNGLGMNPVISYDPHVTAGQAAAIGVRMVSLDELMAEADFVTVHCPLTSETRNLIGPAQIALMKPGAYLINVARGGVVDEDALYDALESRRIAGAGIDCFVGEPLAEPPKFARLDNVIMAPHGIAIKEEHGRRLGTMSCQAMLDLSLGRKPVGVLNPEVFDRPGFQAKWKRLTGSLE